MSSVPQGKCVLAKVFPDGEGMPTDCGRFVLTDEVELDGESWFRARCRELPTRTGFTGLPAFADDVRRTNVQGEVVFLGRLGISYRAGNAMFLGRGTARTVQLLPGGRVFGERAVSKIRKGEKGWRGAAARLEASGAPPVAEDPCERLTWLLAALAAHTRPRRATRVRFVTRGDSTRAPPSSARRRGTRDSDTTTYGPCPSPHDRQAMGGRQRAN